MGTLSGIDWFPLWLSLRVAALATAAVLVVGTWIAYMLSHKSFRGKDLIDSLITLPLVLPPTVLGYYLLVLLSRSSPLGHAYESVFGQPLVFTWKAAVVAAFLHSAPLFIKAVRAALVQEHRPPLRTGGAQPRRLGVAHILLCHAAACEKQSVRSRRAVFCACAGRFRSHHHAGRQYPRPDANALGRDLRRGGIGRHGQLARVLVVIVSLAAIAILWPANWLAEQRTKPGIAG